MVCLNVLPGLYDPTPKLGGTVELLLFYSSEAVYRDAVTWCMTKIDTLGSSLGLELQVVMLFLSSVVQIWRLLRWLFSCQFL
jgi:hypothetical protein